MESTEKALLLQLLNTFSSSENSESKKEENKPLFQKNLPDYLNKLKSRAGAIANKSNFQIGDIVLWKEGLKNKRYPQYSQPAIVIEVYNEPLIDEDISYNEKLDIRVGFITEDDEFMVFNYDSSRFEIFKL